MTLLRAEGLVKHHVVAGGRVHAVDGVDLSLEKGRTLGLVGESGCGKSTLGRTLIRLEAPDAGRIWLEGTDISTTPMRALRPLRSRMQIVFQDPFSSLNPRRTVAQILGEPFAVHGIGTRAERAERVASLLARVGLRPEQGRLYPHQFSGGQRQRIAIARAIALEPALIVCDEPVSALDVSVQAQILNLLAEMRGRLQLSYLFISHDLAVVGHVSDEIAVMYLGRIVEHGPTHEIWRRPQHPYTRMLFGALPLVDAEAVPRADAMKPIGEPASPLHPPSGCRFRTRCPMATSRCAEEAPALAEKAPAHTVACHLV